MTDEKLELDLEEPESLELEPATPSGNIIVIPPDVIRTVSELPSDPEIGTVVALVSDDESKVNGFYIATEKTEDGTVWTLYVTSGSSAELDDGSVTESKIADGAVTSYKIASNSITRSHIKKGAIIQEHLDAYIVDDTILAPNSVGDGHIKEDAVMEKHIFRDAVTTDKIKDKAITKEKIAFDIVNGKSAYEIALENGFEGTEQEWLESLKLYLTKTEHKTINLFDNIFDEEGYINNGVDTAHASFHRTSYREIKRVTDVLHIRLVEAVPSFVVVLYTTDKKYINTYSCNNLASKDITLSADNVAFFRIYSNKNTSSSARALITTEEIPDELTSEELLELINGKYVTTYLNEDFKNLVEEVQNLKDNTVSASSDKANRISTVKNYAENQESIRAFERSYYVGVDKTYTTIDAALKQWKADGYPKATVYISNGEYIADADNYCGKGYENVDSYRAVIFVDTSTRATVTRDEEGNIITDENGKAVYTYTNIPKTISFIGESREGVVIRTKIGNYVNAPILIRHGNVEIKNMTVIADHSDNLDFNYPTKSDGSRRTQAYALHIDGGDNSAFGESGAKVLVENVTAISYQSPAFGMGTIPNSTIRLENCKAISYTESEENIYNAGYANSRGTILCHKSVAVEGTATKPDTYVERLPEKLELVNVGMYSKNYDKPLYLSGSSDEDYNLLALDTILSSGITENGEGYLNDASGNIVLDKNSSGNTCENLNKEV